MKINILVDNDKCWNLNIVRKLIPFLKKNNILVDHIWILPNNYIALCTGGLPLQVAQTRTKTKITN